MVKAMEILTEKALSLPPRSRAQLAARLLTSLDDPKIDKLWAVETESRLNAAARGKLKPVSGAAALRRLRARVK